MIFTAVPLDTAVFLRHTVYVHDLAKACVERSDFPLPKFTFSAVTTSQLATICGVSQGTVDRALHNRAGISPNTRARVLAAAERYGYVPNIHAQALSGGRTMLLGVVVPDLNNDYFSQLIMELEQQCRAAAYSSVLMFSHKNPEAEIDCLKRLAQMGVDGIVLFPIGQGEDYVSFLHSLRIPVAAVGNRLNGIPFAGINDRAAMQTVTAQLLRKGYEQLVYYAPALAKQKGKNNNAQALRYRGFTEAAAAAGVPTTLLTDANTLQADLTALCQPAVRTAVVCPSDVYALRARAVLADMHRDDIGLSGFDDSRLLTKCRIALSSVGTDYSALAKAAIACVLHNIAPTEIPFYLADRGSF